jgi:hypothetical protein
MRRALVVGIENYPFGVLEGCARDAERLATVLERHDDGTKNFDVRRLTDPPKSLSRSMVREEMVRLFDQPADLALFYFSGHGSENDLGGYLVTSDATRYDEGVPMTEVLRAANDSPVQEAVIIIDCCHSGHLGESDTGALAVNASAPLREGVTVLTATRSSDQAVQAHGGGLFTTLVCAALEGEAADVVGRTTLASVYAFVDQSLGPWDPRPLLRCHVSELLSLRDAAPSVSGADLRRLTELFRAPTDELALDPSYERTHASADPAHVNVFDLLVTFRNARLVEVPVREHLYFVALRSGSVRLTALGRHYWRLVADGRI